MGAPDFIEGTWNGVENAYYVGAGSGWEPIWLFVSGGLCVLALIIGAAHEGSSYRKFRRR